jgi:hypothetical protein
MPWEKPEDLELVAECETLPEAEIVRGLLESAGIISNLTTASDSTIMFAQRSVFGETVRRRPYKILVRIEDADAAGELLAAPADALPDGEDIDGEA